MCEIVLKIWPCISWFCNSSGKSQDHGVQQAALPRKLTTSPLEKCLRFGNSFCVQNWEEWACLEIGFSSPKSGACLMLFDGLPAHPYQSVTNCRVHHQNLDSTHNTQKDRNVIYHHTNGGPDWLGKCRLVYLLELVGSGIPPLLHPNW